MQFFRPAVQVQASSGLSGFGALSPLDTMRSMTTATTQNTAPAAAAGSPMSFNWIGDIATAVGGVVNSVVGAATLPEQQRLAQIQAQQAGAYAQAQIQSAESQRSQTTTLVLGGLAALVIGGGLLYVLKPR